MTADRPADARPAFGVAELEDLERRMQGILDPDDAIEAAFVALTWLAAALSSAGLAVVPAGEVREEIQYGPLGCRADEIKQRVVRTWVGPWLPVEP